MNRFYSLCASNFIRFNTLSIGSIFYDLILLGSGLNTQYFCAFHKCYVLLRSNFKAEKSREI